MLSTLFVASKQHPLLERQSIPVDADFIGPIVEESGREFRQIFLGGH
ncbi:MAG: hypothetical protein HYY45_12575 [Deltaproteobacteria bacterium]|nr:hypothetical protein [Deltaproteobacteria bacterium]